MVDAAGRTGGVWGGAGRAGAVACSVAGKPVAGERRRYWARSRFCDHITMG